MSPNAPAPQTLWQVCSAGRQPRTLTPACGIGRGARGHSRSIPSDFWDAVWASWTERKKDKKKKTNPAGATGWRQSPSRAPQLWSWESSSIELSQVTVSLQFKYQVFIQQSSHTVGPWFIWLGYLPERNNLASSNSCDFSASLIKTPLFHYFLSSHTPHPH